MVSKYYYTGYRITMGGVYLTENALGNPNLVQVSVSSGCVIIVRPEDDNINQSGIVRLPNGESPSWNLTGVNTRLNNVDFNYIYARLERSTNSSMLIFDTRERNVDGSIKNDENSSADEKYYYIKVGEITATDSLSNPTQNREITFDFGYYQTDGYTEDYINELRDMMVGKLDQVVWDRNWEEKKDPNGLDYIFTTKPIVTAAGVTMYSGDTPYLPSMFEGIPLDGETLAWVDGKIAVVGGIGQGGITGINVTGTGNAVTGASLSADGLTITLTKGSEFALKSDIPSLGGYATQSWVNTQLGSYATTSSLKTVSDKLNNFLEGTDTDGIINKWKELENFLAGQTQTSTLAQLLSGKADKATTLAGYGITDAYTKTEINTVLGDYVTKAGAQDITGVKSFINGLKVGDILVKKHADGVVEIEGDLVVTGGVTMYGIGNHTASTILDALPIDSATLSKEGGKLTVIGGTGASTGSITLNGHIYEPDSEGNITLPSYPTTLPASDVHDWAKSSTKPTYTFTELTSHPTTIAGYGITDAYTKSEINSTLANYATNASLSAVSNKLNTFLEGTDTDGIINKWKELENFLAGQTQTSTLAQLLSGKADKATTLAGYGITDAYTKSQSDSKYVTSLSTSGDYLTWTKNGVTNNIGISFAGITGKLRGSYATGVANAPGDSFLIYSYNNSSSLAGLFPADNNANGIITMNTHAGNYFHQLGFSSNGNIYHRYFNGEALNTTKAWVTLLTSANYMNILNSKYVTLDTVQTITGVKSFVNGLKVGDIAVKKHATGVIEIDGNLIVTGGITMYAQGSHSASTILDALPVDPDTLSKEGGVLSVIGGVGGGSVDGIILNGTTYSPNADTKLITLPNYPTSLPASDVYAWAKAANKPSYAFSEITSKPTTLAGYGITDAVSSSTLGNYVQKAGDTMSGTLTVAVSNNKPIIFNDLTGRKINLLSFYSSGAAYAAFGVQTYYLFQTATGVDLVAKFKGSNASASYIAFTRADNKEGYVGIDNSGVFLDNNGRALYVDSSTEATASFFDGTNKHYLLHTGNAVEKLGTTYVTNITGGNGALTIYNYDAIKTLPITANWTAARTLTLTGDVTGSVSMDGSENVSLSTSYAFDSLDSRYVTSLGVNGDSLTWIKNGVANSLTIPYAGVAGKLRSLYIASVTTAPGNGNVTSSYNMSSSTSGIFPVSDNANGLITINTHNGNYFHQLGFSSNGNLYHRAFSNEALNTSKPWVQLLTTGNYTDTLDGRYYTESEADSRFVNVTGDTMTGKLMLTNSGGGTQFQINNTNGGETFFYLSVAGVNKGAFTTNHSSYGTCIFDATSYRYLGIKTNGTPHFQGNTIWHAGNDGPGSGLNADLFDDRHRSNLYNGISNFLTAVGTDITVTVNGDKDTYYPVYIDADGIHEKNIVGILSVYKDLGTPTAVYPGNHSNGTSSLWLTYEYRSNIWDGNGGYLRTKYKYQGYATLIANTATYSPLPGIVVWLRGGGTNYQVSYSNGKPTATVYYSETNLNNAQYPAVVAPMTTISNAGIVTGPNLYTNVKGALDGNASSATKLQTSRTINGTSFNGTANIVTSYWGTARTFYTNSHDSYRASSGVSVNGSGNVTLLLPNSIRCSDWFRSTGATGWYNETYGGGMYMTDSSYVKVFNNKRLRVNSLISCGEYQDDTYGYMNVTRPNDINACCYAFVKSGVYAFGMGYTTDNGIWLGVPNTSRQLSSSWLTIKSGRVSTSGSLSAGSLSSSNSVYANNGYLISTCNTKTIQIGCQNASHCHYSTTAPSHWFNTRLDVNGGIYPYGGARELGTSGNPWSTIYTNSWFRSVGNTGWYSQTYNGGIYMTDTTYVRVYNGKSFYVPGNILATGGVTMYGSDVTKKDVISHVLLPLDYIARAPLWRYRWNDQRNDRVNVGGSAQYTRMMLKELVGESDKGLVMDYATTAYAFSVCTARHFCDFLNNEFHTHETEIEKLKRENRDMKRRIEELERRDA